MIEFFVQGIPVAQGSKRHVGNGVMIESSKALRPWRDLVQREAYRKSRHKEFTESVYVLMVFSFPRPKTHYGTGKNAGTLKPSAPAFKATAPDLDKLCRAVLDGIVAGGLLRDDSLVSVLEARKVYGGRNGVHVEVRDA